VDFYFIIHFSYFIWQKYQYKMTRKLILRA